MSTYVVGDIQGCLEPLQCLLRAVNFDPEQDVLWSVGDIVNRGPQSLDCLRFLYDLRDSLVVVLGNHDLHLLAVAAGVHQPARSDTLAEILVAPDRELLLAWLAQQPLLHREHGFTMVHAGIPPQWTAQQASAYAGEVEAALAGPRATDFLAAMYGNEPLRWSDDLTGTTRLRVITNYLTRLRYCTATGAMDFTSKGPLPDTPELQGESLLPWFAHAERKTANTRILFGHWAALQGETASPTAIGLDTGCVWGGAMTLYRLDTGQRTHCDCPQ